MGRGIVIPFSLDPRKFARGIKTITTDLESVERAFDDVEDASRDMGDGIERAFSDVGRNAQRQLDDLPRRARKAADDTSDEMRRGLRGGRLGAIGSEAGQEFTQSFGEAIRSGDMTGAITETLSSAGSIVGSATDSLKKAFGAMGVVAAGALVISLIQKMNEEKQNIVNASKSLFGDVVDQAAAAGKSAGEAFSTGYLEVTEIPDRLAEMFGTDIPGAMDKVLELANKTGLSVDQIAQALLGNREALALVAEQWQGVNDKTGEQAGALEEVLSKGRQLAAENEKNVTRAQVYKDLTTETTDDLRDRQGVLANTKVPDPGMPKTLSDAQKVQIAIERIPTNKRVNVSIDARIAPSTTAAARAILRGDTRF